MSFGLSRRALAACAVVLASSFFTKAHAIPDLSVGPFGPGTIDGSEPFNVFGSCANTSDTLIEGEDCGEGNGVVRTQDTVSHVWSVTADNYDPGAPDLTDVVIEQTITPSANADISFESLPIVCLPAGGGGTNPASGIVENSDGSSVMTCNLGEFEEGEQKSFTAVVKVSGLSWNGSNYTSSQRVYSLDSGGNENANSGAHPNIGPIMISARPAYDLVRSINSTQGFYNTTSVTSRAVKDLDGDGSLDSELGFLTYGLIRLAATRKTGIESIQQPIVFQDSFAATALAVDGDPYALEMYVTECRDNPTLWGGEVYGKETYNATYDGGSLAFHAIDSGTCDYVRSNPTDPTSLDFTVTIDNADLSGNRYPTKSAGNIDLSAGPYYATDHRVQYWIPFRSVDMTDGVMDNQGSVYLSDVLTGFDPNGVSGVSNFGNDGSGVTDVEPGHDGALMDTGLRSNNRLGPTNYFLTVRGSFSKRIIKYSNDAVTSYEYTGQASYHAGDGEREPTQTYLGWIYYGNNGTLDLENPMACDVFDNTTQQLVDRGETGGTAGTYAYMGTYSVAGFDHANYMVEYANVDLTGDDPLDEDHDGTLNYDITSGRYNGDWEKAKAIRCDDGVPAGGWHTDPTQVSGGIDSVNAVRTRLTDTAIANGVTLEPTQYMRFVVPLKARETFNGGPHNGQEIPVGTVLANFATVRSDNWSSGWSARNYEPAPENGNVDGDRVTLTRIQAFLDSESISPVAAPGNTATILAGGEVVWKLTSSVQSTIPNPSDAENLHIVSVIPPEATYNASCTSDQADGTPPSLVEYNTDKDGNPAPGYTRLTWSFGDVTANTPILDRIFCTDTDPLALNGTSVVLDSEIRADNVITSVSYRDDTHTIRLEQTGSIQVSKSVDMPLDDQNDDQVYEIAWSNFAPAFTIDAPTIIDVFSYTSGNGDGDAKDAGGNFLSLSPRTPESDFNGKFELTGAPTITWLDGSVPGGGDPNPELGTWTYSADAPETINYDPDNNTSNWCLEADFGNANCPTAFSDVTAIKFVSNYVLEKDGDPRQGMRATYTMQAGDNVDPTSADINLPGDIYTNRFTFDSTSLPAAQYLRSNNVSVQISAFAIGDLIFADVNSNGKYDVGTDGFVPDGTTVELYKVESDGSEAKVMETTTGTLGSGRYLFEPLASGDYYIQIPAAEFQPGGNLVGWDISPPTGQDKENDDANDHIDQHGYTESTALALGVRTGIMTLSANPPPPGGIPTGNEPLGDNNLPIVISTGDDFSNLSLDIGLASPLSSISNMVWTDSNNNGLQDVGELGLSNVTVNLLDDAGNVIDTARTDNDGYYNFSNLVANDYMIEVIKPAGYAFSTKDAGADDTADSDTDPNTGRSDMITIGFGQHDTQWDSGLYELGSIGNRVWVDLNDDGLQDLGETTGLENITVILRDSGGTEITRMDTDANGNYLFANLPPTDYIVDIDETDTDLVGYTLTTANDPVNISLAAGQDYLDADFGYVNYGSVGDKVWHDLNGNGVQDAGESGITGVTVRLLDSTGTTILQTVTTGANGDYLFSNVPPEDYIIEFVKPTNYTDFVSNDLGGDDTLDSDAVAGTGRTGVFSLAAGQNRTDIDSGLYQAASLGNLVWLDENGDSIQTSGEMGLAGIAVDLSGTLGNGQLYQTLDNTTDSNGNYQFTGLYPGVYTVSFGTAGFVTADQGGDDSLDSDVVSNSPVTVTLESGNNNQTIDAGIAAASVTGRVWIDNNAQNSIDEGTANEDGVVGVTVNLIDPATGDTVDTTTTGADGIYSFTGVNPANYLIEVVEPANMGFVTQDQGDDLSDSDVNPATGQTALFTLSAGQNMTDIDAGIEPGSLGDHVTLDLNNNGIQDAGEPGVEGIVVTLIDSGNATIDTQSTDATGFYNFSGVVPGNYTVHFDVPADMSLATANIGSDDTIDFDPNASGDVTVVVVSGQGDQTIDAGIVPATLGDRVWFDENGDGLQTVGEPGIADIIVNLVNSVGDDVLDAGGNPISTTTDASGNYSFSVLPGTYGVKFTLPNDMAFTTADAGGNDTQDSDANVGTGITPAVTLTSGDTNSDLDAGIAPASISGTVLSDSNGNGTEEAGDNGVASVTLTLTGTDILGNPVSETTTTDVDGNYSFSVLPGSYEITETNPVGTTSSGAEQGSTGSTVVNPDIIKVTVANGESSTDNDFLDYQPASLSGQVREDSNGDGDTNDAGDSGIAGVEIILWKDTDGNGTPDTVYANTTTNGDGDYSFTDIPPGSYVVTEGDLDTYNSTTDTDGANDNRIAVTLASGENSPNHDFLDTRPANISGQVREDVDRDGDLNETEAGITGVTVTLYTDPNGDGDPADGTVVTSTTTDVQGDYQFNNVMPGQYVVVETDPADYESTADITAANDNRVSVTLLANANSTDNDFLDTSILGSLSGVVWSDTTPDSNYDNSTEGGIPNVTVLVKGTTGNVVATLTTNANGAYSATDLPGGNYTVEIVPSTLPVAYLQTGDPDSNLDHMTLATVTSGNNTADLNFGYVASASIGDRVWHDENANGVQDADETGISNVIVKLLNATDDSVISTTTTDALGNYSFTGLMQGNYKVEFVKPEAYAGFTKAEQGGDSTMDSNFINNNGRTLAFTLASGENNTSIDAGLYQSASLGDTVWFDTNGNGIQDPDEPGIEGVDVRIVGGWSYSNSQGSLNATIDLTVQTDANGNYLFEGLLPADYNVTFTLPASMSFTSQDQGGDDMADSDVAANGTTTASLLSGQTDLSIDAGVLPAEITGRVWIDNSTENGTDDGTGSENGVVGVNVNLIDVATGNAVLTTTTGADGIYTFTGVMPGEYIVEVVEPANMGFVTADQGADDSIDSDVNPQDGRSPAFTIQSGDSVSDIDAGIEPGELGDHVWLDENNNGQQDSGEPGIADITVNLLDSNGSVVSTQTTDATGFYNFTGVAPENYEIEFVLPANMSFAEQNRGTDDSLDSDPNVGTGRVPVTVISGVGNQTVDAGVIPATIGNTIWFDANNNGVQDAGEMPLAGITVNLIDNNGNAVNDAAGNPITTETDENGNYAFIVLPDTYGIEVELPAGAGLTTQDAGADDNLDSDASPTNNQTAAITVNSGDNIQSLDAGVEPATISGRVIIDNNANGSEDVGDTTNIANVTITITGTDIFGNPVTQTVLTDPSGNYTANLPPGTYTVTETTPNGYDSTGAEAGTAGSMVVNADTLTVTVNSGEISEQNDFLDTLPAQLSGQVREDSNGDGDTTDASDTGIAGVEIILWEDTDGDGNPDVVVANTTTNATGNYNFTDIPPGNYIIVESDPTNTVSTADTTGDNDNQIPVTLSSNENATGNDFLDTYLADISGQVRDDNDRDGNMDDTDEGIAGVTVTLYTDPNGDGDPADGQIVITDATDAQGDYSFTGIVPGNYVVVETDPEDYESTADTSGTDAADNDNRIPVSHQSNQDSVDNDFLDTSILGSLSGVIWSDTVPDGNYDNGAEGGIPNVTVIIKDQQGATVATVTTNNDGSYQVNDLPAGNYTVEVNPSSLPADSIQTGDPDTNLDDAANTVVVSGQNTADINFGYVTAASVGDLVWEDLNANGIQDAGELGIADVAVSLVQGGNVLETTVTDTNGAYLFDKLLPGDYEVIFTTPANYYPTSSAVGSDATVDSDATSATPPTSCPSGACTTVDVSQSTAAVTLMSGSNLDIDAGFYQLGNLGNTVWLDWDENGLQQIDEPVISDVVVNLLDNTGNPVQDENGNVITATTDTDGKYLFTGLRPDNYIVEFIAPAGATFTTADQGDDALDSDAQANGQAPAVVTSNQTNDTVDAGITPAAVSGRVWIDNNSENAIDDGTASENGVIGVTVNLIDNETGLVVATTTSGADGVYNFTQVLPSDYMIEVIEPMNMELVAKDQGSDDTIDSDVDPENGRSDVFTLTSGNTIADMDAGILPGALGDHVFLDSNENGVQDSGEPGVENVTVNLMNNSGTVVETQTTDVTGFYNFNAELPGEYTVEFVLPNGMTFTTANVGTDDTVDSDANSATGQVSVTVVSGVTNQTVDAGILPAKIGDTVWLDIDGDGTQGGSEPVLANVDVTLLDGLGNPALDKGGNEIKTVTNAMGHYEFIVEPGSYGVLFTLPENTEFTVKDQGSNDAADSDADLASGQTATVTVSSGDNNDTLDAGIKPATISGSVLLDNNGDAAEDGSDTPLDNVTVTLQGTDVFGNPVLLTTSTDGNGDYHFDVPPGDYSITETNPTDYVSSAAEAGTTGSTIINNDIINVTVASGEASNDNDFLDYQVASLSGQVRDDMNGDRDTSDANDPAIADVKIVLWRDNDGDGTPDTVFANTTTDADGNYSFNDIPPGSYVVVETDSTGYESTADTTGDNDNQIAVTLASGEDSPNHDFLDTRPMMISGQVREDTDRDGDLADSDTGMADTTVMLYSDPNGDGDPSDGVMLLETKTDSDGHYQFENVMPGMYVIMEQDPDKYASTGDTKGAPDDNMIPVEAVSGQNNTGNDLLDTLLLGTINGTVWDDENADRTKDGTEPFFPNVAVALVDNQGNTVGTTTTDGNGDYHFTDLTPADYTVVIDPASLPANTQQTGDPDSTLDNQTTVTVLPQTDTNNVDFGYVALASLGNKVWHDLNANGIQDNDEPGIEDVKVFLLKEADGQPIATTTTNGDGEYLFSGLLPDEYLIKVEMPTGYDRFSQMDAGGDDALDSDVDSTGITTPIALSNSENNRDADAGVYAYASLGNIVWLDKNDDDLQQDGEPGVENITVTLTGTNAEGQTINETTQTDVNGNYNFNNLVPGDYSLNFDIDTPVGQDANGNADDTRDSDIDNSGNVSTVLTSGESDDSIDAGVSKGSIGDHVWEDMNGNGIQDPDEPGIAGVVVTLYSDPDGDGDPSDGEAITTTATDVNGDYIFDGLLPDDYVVHFTTPDEHYIGQQDQGQNDTLDSDMNSQGYAPVTINSGVNTNVDAAFYQLGSLGDRVWLDSNNDGYQNDGEPSISEITVELYDLAGNLMTDLQGNPYQTETDEGGLYRFDDLIPAEYQIRFRIPEGVTYTQTDRGADDAIDSDANANGEAVGIVQSGEHNDTVDAGLVPAALSGRIWIDNNEQNGVDDSIDDENGVVGVVVNLLDENGEIVQSTTSGSNGLYTFDAVLPGQYQIEFIEPANMSFVDPDQGSDDTIDSDANRETGRTPIFEITSGQSITDIDAGIEPGSLGDRVWLDVNNNGLQDADETGIEGINVHLLDSQSLTIASTTTDENGFYSFTDVVPSSYTVMFERPPNMQFVEANKGDDNLDSDVDVNGAVPVTVQSGTAGDQSIDAGIVPAVIGGTAWLDNNVNDLQTEGENGLQGITVTLINDEGNPVQTTVTDENGNYEFTVVPGDYQVTFDAPNSGFSQLNQSNNDDIDSDVDETGLSHEVSVNSGETDTTVDAGIIPAMISGSVLEDQNANGVLDTTETPLPNTQVTLVGTDSYGTPVTVTTTTDEQGQYQFIVPPGSYTIIESNPEEHLSSGVLVSPDSIDNVAIVDNDSVTVNVMSSDVVENLDFLDYQLLSVSGTVVDDHDGDITTPENNQPVSNAEVQLFTDPNGDGNTSDGQLVQTVTTDEQGNYVFDDVKPGTYVVVESDPNEHASIGEVIGEGSVDTTYPEGNPATNVNNNEIPLNLQSGIDSTGNNFFDVRPVTVTGVIVDDADYDGDLDELGEGLPGVTVSIFTDPNGDGDPSDGELVATTVTNQQGEYQLENIIPGSYVIVESDPTDFNSTADSSTDGNNDNRIPVTLVTGEDVNGQNFLDTKPLGTIGGQVQNDTDHDGDTADPDSGIPSVTVTLWTDPNGDGNPSDGEEVSTTQSDSNGNYQFTNVIVGNYVIVQTDRPGFVSTGDSALGNDNRIPLVVSMDDAQHCRLPSLLRSNALASCTAIDFMDREINVTIDINKTSYSGHDSGAKCGTDAAKDELVLVDRDKNLQEPATYCFEITNTGESYLNHPDVIDATLNIDKSDMTPIGAVPANLPPTGKIMYYYEYTVKDTIENQATATAKPSTEDGTLICEGLTVQEQPSFCTPDASDVAEAVIHFVFDPPSALKTVTPSGNTAMVWQMVWINSSPVPAQVQLYDPIPEGTHFYPMPAGDHVSADGVYCEARGTSVTDSCTYEAASAEYPRGRIIWTGTIGGDVGHKTEDDAANEVVIRLMTELDDTSETQEISNRAYSDWDMDGDGNPEFEDLSTHNGGDNTDGSQPTKISIGNPMKIPTMSFWTLFFMSLLMGAIGFYRRKKF